MDASHRNSLKPGHLVHWYKIEKILGQGGFGITYLATDTNLNQKVAIKEYLPVELAVRDSNNSLYPVSEDRKQQYSWGLERFIVEAQTLAKFDHHNIVRVLTVFESNNTAYMLMRYEEGDSLQDILKAKKTLEEKILKSILLPILDGLAMVHAEGFIHRDIKPANIYIRSNGSPVLLDFGAARQSLGEVTKTLTSMVSSGYAPFEQYFSKSDQQGPWTDIYGLGATMYRGITSKMPMDAIDRSNSILHISEDTLVSAYEIGRGNYSETFLKSVDHALQFKYQDRPQSIADWLKELRAKPILTTGKPVKKKDEENILTKVAKQENDDLFSKDIKEKPNLFKYVVGSIVVFALLSLFYIYNNPNILIDKEKPKEKILTIQEELEMRRKELLLLEGKAQKEKARQEELARLKAERERKIAEEKARKKKEVEDKQRKVESLLTQAGEDIESNRLVSPKGNNAYEKYREVLELSLENTGANEGIERIGNIFISEAQLAIESKNFKRASKLIDEANKIIPDAKSLKEKQKALRAAIEEERVAEEKRIAVENAKKIKEEKEQKIKALLIEADSNITAKRLISPEENNAYVNYKNILEIYPEHAAAKEGLLNITNLLASDLQNLIDNKKFSEADKVLKEMLAYFPNSKNIKESERALVAAKLEVEKEKVRLSEEKRLAAEKARKQEEEKQLLIKTLLDQAKNDINEERFLEPKDGNAIETYEEVLKLSPGNAEAKQGIIKVANALVAKAKEEIVKNEFIEAENRLNDAASITPSSHEIEQVYELLKAEKLKIKKNEAEKLILQANEAVDKSEFDFAKKILEEARVLDPDSKKLQVTQKKYEEGFAKQLEEEKRVDEIKQLLVSAQINIREKKLTTPKSNNALEKFKRVLELDPKNEEANNGIRTLFDRYIELAKEASDTEDYVQAGTYVNKANNIIPDDPAALILIESLEPKLSEIEKLKKEEAEKKAEQERIAKDAELKKMAEKAEQERIAKEVEAKRLAEEKKRAEAVAAKQAEIKRLAEEEANRAKNAIVGEFVEIPGGSFNFKGNTLNVNGFKMAKNEISIGQWKKIMGTNSIYNDKCDNCAITTISRLKVLEFINKLNLTSKKSYRLPTAVEWLYACKKGGNTKECNGRNISAAYVPSNELVNVKNEKIDQLGLQGMGGVIYEFTCSRYSEKYKPDWRKCMSSTDNYISVVFGNKKYMDTVSYGYWQQNVHNQAKLPNTGFRLVLD